MKKRFSVKKRAQVAPDMNVTPLVDVVLVLLIIFMVITPQLEHDIHVDLPSIFNPDKQKAEDPLELTVSKQGDVYIEGEIYTKEQLPAKLMALHEQNPDKAITIRADVVTEFTVVREVFAMVRQQSFSSIALMVSKTSANQHKPLQ